MDRRYIYSFIIIFMVTFVWSDTYTRTYSPVNGDTISRSSLMGEFDDIGTVLNGNLGTVNVDTSTIGGNQVVAGTMVDADFSSSAEIPLSYVTATTSDALLQDCLENWNRRMLCLQSRCFQHRHYCWLCNDRRRAS